MHYAFENVSKTRMMLENVSKYLRRGGIFLGTVPNAEWLMYVHPFILFSIINTFLCRERLSAIPKNQAPEFGNAVFRIRFEQHLGQQMPTFGHRYWFFLKDAVEDVPEYVVHWEHFERYASHYEQCR